MNDKPHQRPDPTSKPQTMGLIPMLLLMAAVPIGTVVLLGTLRWLLGYLGI